MSTLDNGKPQCVLTQQVDGHDVEITFDGKTPKFTTTWVGRSSGPDMSAWCGLIIEAASGSSSQGLICGNMDTRLNVLKICIMFGYEWDPKTVSEALVQKAHEWARENGFTPSSWTMPVKFEYEGYHCKMVLKKYNTSWFIVSQAMDTPNRKVIEHFAERAYYVQNIGEITVYSASNDIAIYAQVAIFADHVGAWEQLKLQPQEHDRAQARQYNAVRLIKYWDAAAAATPREWKIKDHVITKVTDADTRAYTYSLGSDIIAAIQDGSITDRLLTDIQAWAELAAFMQCDKSLNQARDIAKIACVSLDETRIEGAKRAGL